ncbi:MAG TPA: hypothetical protein VLA04_06460 [Verrucomicrobiae bacterium]|nr:hypothetical protein [Verrucomicrobiae bacterium]
MDTDTDPTRDEFDSLQRRINLIQSKIEIPSHLLPPLRSFLGSSFDSVHYQNDYLAGCRLWEVISTAILPSVRTASAERVEQIKGMCDERTVLQVQKWYDEAVDALERGDEIAAARRFRKIREKWCKRHYLLKKL